MKKVLAFIKEYIAQILVVITVVPLAIVFKQRFIKLLPCLITIVVMYFDSKFNRYARLIGGFNCIIYSIGYFVDGLYGSVISALAYSFPLQIITFILWNKNKYKQGTIVKLMSNKFRILTLLGLAVISAGYILIFSGVESSNYTWLQGIQFSLGLGATVFIMFGIMEGMFINIVSNVLNIIQYVLFVVSGETNQVTYLVMGVYTTYCLVVGLVNWIKLYKEQQLVKNAEFNTIENN